MSFTCFSCGVVSPEQVGCPTHSPVTPLPGRSHTGQTIPGLYRSHCCSIPQTWLSPPGPSPPWRRGQRGKTGKLHSSGTKRTIVGEEEGQEPPSAGDAGPWTPILTSAPRRYCTPPGAGAPLSPWAAPRGNGITVISRRGARPEDQTQLWSSGQEPIYASWLQSPRDLPSQRGSAATRSTASDSRALQLTRPHLISRADAVWSHPLELRIPSLLSLSRTYRAHGVVPLQPSEGLVAYSTHFCKAGLLSDAPQLCV